MNAAELFRTQGGERESREPSKFVDESSRSPACLESSKTYITVIRFGAVSGRYGEYTAFKVFTTLSADTSLLRFVVSACKTTSSMERIPSRRPAALITGKRRTFAFAIVCSAERTSSSGLQE